MCVGLRTFFFILIECEGGTRAGFYCRDKKNLEDLNEDCEKKKIKDLRKMTEQKEGTGIRVTAECISWSFSFPIKNFFEGNLKVA